MTISREKVLAAICSVRVQVDGDMLMYADEDGTLPIHAPDETEAGLLTDAVMAALQEEQPEPEYEYALQHKQRGGLATGLSKHIIDLLDADGDRADYTVLRRPKHTWEVVE